MKNRTLNIIPGAPDGWTPWAEPGWPGYWKFIDDTSPKRPVPITEEELQYHTKPIGDITPKERPMSEHSESLWKKLKFEMVKHAVHLGDNKAASILGKLPDGNPAKVPGGWKLDALRAGN